jgi:hypothetical protein
LTGDVRHRSTSSADKHNSSALGLYAFLQQPLHRTPTHGKSGHVPTCRVQPAAGETYRSRAFSAFQLSSGQWWGLALDMRHSPILA